MTETERTEQIARELIRGLRPREREAIYHYCEGRSDAEVSDLTGIPVAKFRALRSSLIRRIRERPHPVLAWMWDDKLRHEWARQMRLRHQSGGAL